MDTAAAEVRDEGFFEGFVALLHGGFWGGCALRSAGVGKTGLCLDKVGRYRFFRWLFRSFVAPYRGIYGG